jgi:DNA-binding NarL/FixJ family response regulator
MRETRYQATRVLLADPHTLVLEGLRALLSSDYQVVGCVRDGQGMVREAIRLQPDLVVSEVRLADGGGIEAARGVRAACPRTRVVFLTTTEDEMVAAQGFAAGASGYLLKTATGDELVAALRTARQGGRTLSRRIAGGRPEALPAPRPAGRSHRRLSPRAGEVVRRLAQGYSMKQVGAFLGITTRTVAFHKYRAMELLGIDSSAGLVRYAVESGLVGKGNPAGASARPLGAQQPSAGAI